MQTNTALSGLEPLIGVEELAEYLDVPVKTLYEWHQTGKGAVLGACREAPAVLRQRCPRMLVQRAADCERPLPRLASGASLRTPSAVRSPRSSTAPGALSWLPRCRAHIVGDHQAALREPDETVNPVTAEILEALAPRRRVELGDT